MSEPTVAAESCVALGATEHQFESVPAATLRSEALTVTLPVKRRRLVGPCRLGGAAAVRRGDGVLGSTSRGTGPSSLRIQTPPVELSVSQWRQSWAPVESRSRRTSQRRASRHRCQEQLFEIVDTYCLKHAEGLEAAASLRTPTL